MVGERGALIANFVTGFIKIHNWIICRENSVRGLCSLSPLTHHPAAKPGPHLVSHQGTTAVNECAVNVMAGDRQTGAPCSGGASPWGFTQTRSANTGDVAGLQHETSAQRRSCPCQAGDAGSIFCSHHIASHTHHDRLKNSPQSSYVFLQRGFFFCVWYWLHKLASILYTIIKKMALPCGKKTCLAYRPRKMLKHISRKSSCIWLLS